MNIYGKKVVLRAMEKEDCGMVRDMFNDPDIESKVVGWAFPLSMYSQERWFENHYNDKDFRFIIDTEEFGPIGVATLLNIDWKNRVAEHGIKMCSNSYRGKGYGKDTVMAIMRYAFDELQLHRLEGAWFEDNDASKYMYMKCGWKEEGIKRDCVYKRGRYRNLVITGILADDYYALVKESKYWD